MLSLKLLVFFLILYVYLRGVQDKDVGLLRVILFAIVGGIIGFFAGSVIPVPHRGWQLLKSPDKISHIMGIKNYVGILMQAENGKYYAYYNDFGKAHGRCGAISDWCEVWMEVKTPLISNNQDWDTWARPENTNCSFQDSFSWGDPPPPLRSHSTQIECAFDESQYDYKYISVSYVLLDNGELWMYQIERDAFDFIPRLFVSIALGVIIGSVVAIIMLLRNKTNRDDGSKILNIFIVFLGLIGYLVAFFIYPVYRANYGGTLISWHQLDSPNKFSHILGTRVGGFPGSTSGILLQPLGGSLDLDHIFYPKIYNGILAQSREGRYFAYFIDTGNKDEMCDLLLMKGSCEKWIEVPSPSGWGFYDETDCSFRDIGLSEEDPLPPPLQSKNNQIECAVSSDFYDPERIPGIAAYHGATWVYYVLLDNGELWMWKIERGRYDKLPIELAGGIFGLCIGFILRIILLRRNWKDEQEDLK